MFVGYILTWIGDKNYRCTRRMIDFESFHLCNRPALVEDFNTGGYLCQDCYNRILSLPNVTIYPSLEFIEACGLVKIPFRGEPVAKCPQCNQHTLHPFRAEGVIAKCNKCGFYRHKRVKLTQEKYKEIVQKLVSLGLTLEEISNRTGEPLERLKNACL